MQKALHFDLWQTKSVNGAFRVKCSGMGEKSAKRRLTYPYMLMTFKIKRELHRQPYSCACIYRPGSLFCLTLYINCQHQKPGATPSFYHGLIAFIDFATCSDSRLLSTLKTFALVQADLFNFVELKRKVLIELNHNFPFFHLKH